METSQSNTPTPSAVSSPISEQAPTQSQNPISEPANQPNIIDRADAISKSMKAENDRYEELVRRQEAVAARIMLAGRADAGQVQKTPEQTQQESMINQVSEALKRFR